MVDLDDFAYDNDCKDGKKSLIVDSQYCLCLDHADDSLEKCTHLSCSEFTF